VDTDVLLEETETVTIPDPNHLAYHSCENMNQRCFNTKHRDFKWYGGRGITVCAEWLTFAAFWQDMGATWFKGAHLHRTDNDGPYNRKNCQWLTPEEHCKIPHSPRRPQPRPLVERDSNIFDLQSAADYLGKTRRWLRANSVLITHERIGRSFRFERAELDRFRAQHRRQARPGVFHA